MKIKKSLNRIQAALLKKHINEFEEKDGILTEAFIFEGMEDMIFYDFVSSTKMVKGAVFI